MTQSIADCSMRAVDHFAGADAEVLPGRQLAAIREAAPSFKDWLRSTGMPGFVRSCDLIALPYPRRFALWRSSRSPAPFVRIFNRMIVVQWREPTSAEGDTGEPTSAEGDDHGSVGGEPEAPQPGGSSRVRTLLIEPTEHDLAANTPYFAAMEKRLPRLRSVSVAVHGTVEAHLRRLGIAPDEVDYITFDHLHTQDLRRWLGTTRPQPDLVALGKVPGGAPGEPVEPYFPNARLLVMREEWTQLAERMLHPLQKDWYQVATYGDLRTDKVVLLDGDTQVGPGVALMRTPGHSVGNHSVVLNTSSGIWTSSENGVHAECYTPERSRILGVAAHARSSGAEVVLNGNTIELTAWQYNSMVKEKLVADRGGPGGEWVQHFPSSELTPWAGSPGTSPSFTWGTISHGLLLH
ncbi:MAG: MBL fold metallo-hydrolase [Acidimicrobiales bacterium]